MSCYSKEKMDRNDCVNSIKSQLNKSEREAYRICPSKLSKRELEDLYFTLLESNLELKKTVHKQQDSIRVLSTQVQRMTSNQEKLVNKEMNKECCIGTKTFVNDQKACITELKEANQRMSERIEQLTRRLSSAKQFQKTTPPQPATARQNPFRVTSAPPKKHDCLSTVQESPQQTTPNTPLKLSTPSQWEDKHDSLSNGQETPQPTTPHASLKLSTYSQCEDKSPKKSTQTQITVPIERSPKSDETCDANKCRSLIDELKLKTVTLQEELSMVHFEYSTRIGRLETEVAEVRKENGRVSSERTASQHDLQNTLKRNSDILAEFRKSEAKCAELAAELSIEKRKVAELDTLLKAASLSDRVSKTMEEHLIAQTETKGTAVAPQETDENPLITSCCGGPLPSKDTDRMAANQNSEISIQKDVEDRSRRISPTKYIPSNTSIFSTADKAINVELDPSTNTTTKYELSAKPCECKSHRMSNATAPSTAEAVAAAEVTDRKNPPDKVLSPRTEDRHQQYPSPRYSNDNRLSLGNPPTPPPRDLSTQPEDSKIQGYPYPPPKDFLTRPECRMCRPCETASTSRTKQCCPSEAASTTEPAECGCHLSHAKKKEVICRCPAWVLLPQPLPQCCHFEPPVGDNDKNNSPRGARTRSSPTKEIEDIKLKLQSKTADDTARTSCDSDEMALLKQNKHLLGKILELQNKLDNMKKGVSESPKDKLSSPTSVDSPPLLEQFAEDRLKCINCCFKDEPGGTDSPPSKIDKRLSSKSARTRFSPSTDKYDTKTADDSGYQDSDETALQTMNRELLLKISELQNQIDWMKIGVSQMFEAQSGKLRACEETQTKSTDATVATVQNISPSLLAELTKEIQLKSDKRLSTRSARTRFSPTTDKDDTKSTNTADDSGYQESDEMVLQTMNRELLLKISELQNQIDYMKIGASESSETKLVKSGSVNCSAALIDSPPTAQFQLEDTTLPFQSRPSDERLNRQKLRIEVLGNPTESDQKVAQHIPSNETRAKTVQRRNGALELSDERSTSTSDEYNIVNFDSTIDYKNRKLTITEKKLEVADSNQPDTVAFKFPIETGLVLNPEKLKYLDNERIITKADLENNPSKLKVDVVSIAESVPSNPELGFSIPRLANKEKKGKIDSGRAKTSLAADLSPQRVRNSNLEVLPGTLKLAMNETLAGNYSTAMIQTDENKKKKEDCEYRAACSFDKECELKHENVLNPTTNTLTHGVQKDQIENRDLLNTLQVPDATPTSHYNKKDKKKNLFCHFMKDMNRKQKTRHLSKDEMLAKSQKEAQKTINTASQPDNVADVPLLDQRENGTTNNFLQPGYIQDSRLVTKIKKNKSAQKQKKEDDLVEGSTSYVKHTCSSGVGPNILSDVPLGNKKLSNDSIGVEKNDNLQIPMVEIKMPTEEARLFESTADVTQNPELKLPEKASQAITTTNKGVQIDGDEAKQLASPRDRRRQSSIIQRDTYTLDSHRADSPDTDREMTYLPDLPLENEKRSPGKLRPLSPGEDRITTQTSSSQSDYSRHTTARSSLSEGEMPPCTSKRRSSIAVDKLYLNPALSHKQETTPVHQMETAMNAITAELQRCKHLLHANRSDELPCRASQTTEPRSIALKPATATQGIGNARATMSVFTLHIGTVILCDEAVLYSRNKNLVLKWKFYNQPVTTVRMPSGRVVVFEFCTQYEIKVTNDFLNYLKHEEMPIIIYESDREEQPFATTTLPLRDALILVNTRADKSVALLAGPQLHIARAPSPMAVRHSLPTREEVGVIDLWCMLRTDANLLSGFNLAIAQEYIRTSYPWLQQNRPQTEQAKVSEKSRAGSTSTEQSLNYDFSKYPPIRERLPVTTNPGKVPPPFAPRASSNEPAPAYEANSRKALESELITNEVNTRIKTPEDMVYATGRNARSDARATSDDETSQVYSKRSSLKSVLNRLHRRSSQLTPNVHGGERNKFIEKLKKAGRTVGEPARNAYNDQVEYMEMNKKYENIGKIGANRAEQSKKVTIDEHSVEDTEIERPQEDFVQEPKPRRSVERSTQNIQITVLWLALNEECEAMIDPYVQRLYVAYTFLGRSGAEFETPVSLPKPKDYVEKCYFNFKKSFELDNTDIPKVGHMAACRASSGPPASDTDCIVFSVVSEPAEDPLGIESCEDIGYAFLYLGDLLAYSSGSPGYTEVIPVRAARRSAAVCGVLAVRLDGLDVVRRCQQLALSEKHVRSS